MAGHLTAAPLNAPARPGPAAPPLPWPADPLSIRSPELPELIRSCRLAGWLVVAAFLPSDSRGPSWRIGLPFQEGATKGSSIGGIGGRLIVGLGRPLISVGRLCSTPRGVGPPARITGAPAGRQAQSDAAAMRLRRKPPHQRRSIRCLPERRRAAAMDVAALAAAAKADAGRRPLQGRPRMGGQPARDLLRNRKCSAPSRWVWGRTRKKSCRAAGQYSPALALLLGGGITNAPLRGIRKGAQRASISQEDPRIDRMVSRESQMPCPPAPEPFKLGSAGRQASPATPDGPSRTVNVQGISELHPSSQEGGSAGEVLVAAAVPTASGEPDRLRRLRRPRRRCAASPNQRRCSWASRRRPLWKRRTLRSERLYECHRRPPLHRRIQEAAGLRLSTAQFPPSRTPLPRPCKEAMAVAATACALLSCS